MNANELADSLMGWADDVYGGGETLIEAATMLRQQHAELDAFKLQYYNTGYSIQLRDKDETIRQQQAEIEALKKDVEGRMGEETYQHCLDKLRQQHAEIEALKEALNMGYEETMSYIKLNNLTGSENNQWIVLARKALGK